MLDYSDHALLDVGGNYHRFIESEAAAGCKAAAAIQEGMKKLYDGGITQFKHSYSGFGPLLGRRISKVLSLATFGDESYLFVSRNDVTELSKLKRQRRTLGTQLLRAQEDERKRIVRDLHDSTSQLLVGLQLSLARFREVGGVDPKKRRATARRLFDRSIRKFALWLFWPFRRRWRKAHWRLRSAS